MVGKWKSCSEGQLMQVLYDEIKYVFIQKFICLGR